MMWNAWPPVSFAFDEGEGEGENGDFDGGAGSSVNEQERDGVWVCVLFPDEVNVKKGLQ